MIERTITQDRLEELAHEWWKKLGGKTKKKWNRHKELWIKGYMSTYDIEDWEVVE